MDTDPSVAIVIVNWNKKDYVINLLSSLQTIEYENYELIVIDNASSDDSVEAIKKEYLNLKLIVNKENLGGTGGFNTGIKYALDQHTYDYIWLLDNDAEVEKRTLSELVKAMESDSDIGIAGSRIMDTEQRDITVEAGALIRRDTIGVNPLYRNSKEIDLKHNILDVDYVAICSALVRVKSLEKVGLMDERYFIFWDDMDWGLEFKEAGYRVVAVINSLVYHPAFTEKRGVLVDYYYGNRNSLLAYSKHLKPTKLIPLFYSFLRHKITSLLLIGLNGSTSKMKLGLGAIIDYMRNKWGKKDYLDTDEKQPANTLLPGHIQNILVLNDGNKDEILGALESLKKYYPHANYTLLLGSDRKKLFESKFEHIIAVDLSKSYSVLHLMSKFFQVFRGAYDLSVNFKSSSPFSYAAGKSFQFSMSTEQFREVKSNRRNIWKLVVATICGELLSIVFLPVLWISSRKYKKS